MAQKKFFFYSVIGLVLMCFVWLTHTLTGELAHKPALIPHFFAHMLPALQGTLILGLGFGLPLILISAILGWGQLLLLVNGHISPHLGKEGLMKVLKTLFSQF